MRIVSALVVATLVALPGTLSATVLEIPLPELHGSYPISPQLAERTTTIALPPIAAVNSVAFRVAGSTTVGELDCEGSPEPWPMDGMASMLPLEGLVWSASALMPVEDGAFGWTAEFRSIPAVGVSWDNLLDGEETITLWMAPIAVVGICSTIFAPTAVVNEAVLILDYAQTVETSRTSWSSIKSLYR